MGLKKVKLPSYKIIGKTSILHLVVVSCHEIMYGILDVYSFGEEFLSLVLVHVVIIRDIIRSSIKNTLENGITFPSSKIRSEYFLCLLYFLV